MWRKLGQFILKFRFPLLTILLLSTALMAYWGSKVGMSYEFTRAIPTNHPANVTYQEFKKKYGEDGNLLVIGIQTDQLFTEKMFNSYAELNRSLKKIKGVEDIVSVPGAVNLVKDSATERLRAVPLFPDAQLNQAQLDSAANVFYSLPFYKGLLYNADTKAYLMGVRLNKGLMSTPKRNDVTAAIEAEALAFGQAHQLDIKLSGLPFIRTQMSTRIANEMKWFLFASVILSAVILLVFFRSISAMVLSLGVVIIGVLWSLGTMHLLGYSITLLTALIPPLIVVIGIPNCIYFLNKYHTSWQYLKGDATIANDKERKQKALVNMVSRMGIVTLFCNLAAAIGFAVFALTKSEILQEFGVVSGINIMLLFFISLVLIPAALSLLPAPKSRHTRYLDNARLKRWLDRLERWSLGHRKLIYGVTALLLIVSIAGIFRLKSVGYMVDDIPKTDKIYTDLKFFESNFKGIMPLEILVDTRKKLGVTRNLNNLMKIDSLAGYLAAKKEIARPLNLGEGLKFARQAFFDGDSANYMMPNEYLLPALSRYLSAKGGEDDSASTGSGNNFTRLVESFMDSSRQEARISVNMADVGSTRLPEILEDVRLEAERLFNADSLAYQPYADSIRRTQPAAKWPELIDSSRLQRKANIKLTGASITFLEGSRFIINGLKESIFYAFILIALCMLYLFRSFRILVCSLIPNLIPLVITAGVMGWAGVPLKPSTVLVFSVALGIAIDITIRFLVNYKQELPHQDNDRKRTVIQTIHSTGISIIYTSMVLIAGFVIFCFSGFGGTQALGWLTSLTLVTATFTNLVLLPALLISLNREKKQKK
jgi:predicted RND superfamily exporter protein